MKNKEKIRWCMKQKKGIELVEPNVNLCTAYLKKVENSLKSMKLNYKSGIMEWAVDAAYYARYQSIYALLQRCGIKSEIHDCSLSLFRFLFKDNFDEEMFEQIEKAKEQRVDLTYYTNRLIPKEEIAENIAGAPDFTLVIEEFINKLTTEAIKEYREKVEECK
ncbi:MAG: HEPN domain-containing protein [Nanoarchaeota archaeon]